MEFKMVKRKELIVWLYSLKQVKNIRKYGHVHYISDRLRYVVLYVNANQVDQVTQQLNRLHFVRKVEASMRDDIDMTFKDAIPNRKDPDLKPESGKGNLAGQHKDNFLSDLASSLDKNEAAAESGAPA
ncbi:YlbG family protein [uncultured Abiotrophia sp.]|uniref:YlbG family protein n=1 Tax=uncultured Abiotrophia sp. TaxID=316094 RepID=UPI0026030520|nr:YlbG family protein [uncultured Abiotrophia sp.]